MVRLIGLMLIGLLLMGCVRSLEPVLKPEQSVKVPEIEGKWVSATHEKETLEITPADSGYKAVYVNEQGKSGRYVVQIGRVGGMLVADVTPDDVPETETTATQLVLAIPVHMAFVVTHAGPDLAGKTLNSDWFKSYVAAHPNELATMKHDGDTIISAPTEQIQQFLTKHADDEKAWTEEMLFIRPPAAGVKPANQPAQPQPKP